MRTRRYAAILAVLLVGIVTAVATAAPNRPTIAFVSPTPTDGATVSEGSVTYAFTYNRTSKQTRSLTCTLTSASTTSAAACNPPTAVSGGSSSGASYSNLAAGSYTFTVSLTLTDGATTMATRHFTVALFREDSPVARNYVFGFDWLRPSSPDAGQASADLQPVGGIVEPPTTSPSSASGCDPSDFSGFVNGRVALIQSGTCYLGVKVLNAEAAGASGVVIFNEGNPGRTAVFSGSLLDSNGNTVTPNTPVALTSFALGEDLLNQYTEAVAGGTSLPHVTIQL